MFEKKATRRRGSAILPRPRESHGTVYTYFEDKAAVFKAVVFDLTTQLEREWRINPKLSDPVDRIAEANRNFLDSYSAHSRLFAVVEQVGTTSRNTAVARRLPATLRRTCRCRNPAPAEKTGWSTHARCVPRRFRAVRWSRVSAASAARPP